MDNVTRYWEQRGYPADVVERLRRFVTDGGLLLDFLYGDTSWAETIRSSRIPLTMTNTRGCVLGQLHPDGYYDAVHLLFPGVHPLHEACEAARYGFTILGEDGRDGRLWEVLRDLWLYEVNVRTETLP